MTNRPEQTENKALNKLKKHLEKRFEEKITPPKPNELTLEEAQKFFKTKIEPAYKEIISQLSDFNFKAINYEIFYHTATLRIFEELSSFYFSVKADNNTRKLRIFYSLKYRLAKRQKLKLIRNREDISISFRDIETINPEMIINLFSKWYLNKDKEIEKHKERSA